MLKYNDIITKLTDKQKIRILTRVGDTSGKDMKILGIPRVNAACMKDFCRDIYPHATSLCHAWNPELWENVASDKLRKMVSEDVNLAISPGARIKLSPYRKEISEDTYLASVMSGAHIKAAVSADMTVGASGFYITEADTKWMDKNPVERVLHEYVSRPYLTAASLGGSNVILTDTRALNNAYASVGTELQREVEGDCLLLCDKASEENTVDFISRGIICLEASANALGAALARYKKLKQDMERGEDVTVTDIEEEIQNRTAISDDCIDRALDRVLDFMFKCAESKCTVPNSVADIDRLAVDSVIESTVLLKNKDDILPLDRDEKICIIGDIGFDEEGSDGLADRLKFELKEHGYTCIGTSRGYDMTDIHNKRGESNALLLCSSSDVIILLMGSGYEAEKSIPKTESLTLPPNQLYLADRISALGKKVITVIMSGHAPDIDFTRPMDAVLLTPSEVESSAEALAGIISGVYTPSGRLAYTLYAGTERILNKAEVYRDKYGMKCGPFIGYRYYDTANMRVGYPFGYGLSYTTFSYSDLVIADGQVSFTVENTGKYKGVEVAQIYAGIGQSAVLRPKKELCGFAKIELLPREKKRVTIGIELPKVYNNGEYVIENGTYTISVGASVSDIRLNGSYAYSGVVLESDGEGLSEYLQSHSNILEDNYTLEANYGFMKKTVKNILIGSGALALAISLAMFNITTRASSVFLGVISGILAVCAVAFFLIEVIERSIAHSKERKKIDEINSEYFEGAEEIPVLATDRMFKDEFDTVKEETSEQTDVPKVDTDFDHAEFIDDNFRIADVASEFNKFAAERGFKLGRGVSESFFTSMTTSKLMIVNGLSSAEFNSFMLLLSEYFGSIACVDDASAPVQNQNVFFGIDNQGDYSKKNILLAMQTARHAFDKVQFAAIDKVTAENITDWLNPFVKYIKSSKKYNEISIFDGYGKNIGYTVGRNLWIAVNLANGQTADMLPVALLKSASVVNVTFTECPVEEERTSTHGLNAFQVEYMLIKEAGKQEVSEEVWKKIDKLEKYVNDHEEYSIGNKLWLDLEKQIGMLLSCKMELNDAVDAAIAVRVLPSVTAVLKDKLDSEDRTVLQSIEFIFGEENIAFCKAYIDSLVVEETVEEEPAGEAIEEPIVEEEPAVDAIEEPIVEEEPAVEAIEEPIVEEEPAADVVEEPVAEAELIDADVEQPTEATTPSYELIDEIPEEVTEEVSVADEASDSEKTE